MLDEAVKFPGIEINDAGLAAAASAAALAREA